MANYDASVIVEFANGLYAEADRIVATYTVLGVLVGGGIGAAIGSGIQATFIVALIGAAIVGAIALHLGRQKAFALRLQAQVALCQVQIEANTR